jgi:predicted transcriptional regulator
VFAKVNRKSSTIQSEILQRCSKNGATASDLFYDLRLSWAQVQKKTGELTEKGLLRKEHEKFYTTEKGREWLRAYKRINKLMETETC